MQESRPKQFSANRAVREYVESYYIPAAAAYRERAAEIEMSRDQQLVGAENGYIFKAQIPSTRPAGDFTARVVPHHPGVAIPLEDNHILWQR